MSGEIDYRTMFKPTIDMMVSRLRKAFNPDKIILFGSYGRGNPGPDSDIDLLLMMPDGTDCRKTITDALNLVGDSPIPKDIIVATPELARKATPYGNTLYYALKEGVVLK